MPPINMRMVKSKDSIDQQDKAGRPQTHHVSPLCPHPVASAPHRSQHTRFHSDEVIHQATSNMGRACGKPTPHLLSPAPSPPYSVRDLLRASGKMYPHGDSGQTPARPLSRPEPYGPRIPGSLVPVTWCGSLEPGSGHFEPLPSREGHGQRKGKAGTQHM